MQAGRFTASPLRVEENLDTKFKLNARALAVGRLHVAKVSLNDATNGASSCIHHWAGKQPSVSILTLKQYTSLNRDNVVEEKHIVMLQTNWQKLGQSKPDLSEIYT